jgi:hypothetical protein
MYQYINVVINGILLQCHCTDDIKFSVKLAQKNVKLNLKVILNTGQYTLI